MSNKEFIAPTVVKDAVQALCEILEKTHPGISDCKYAIKDESKTQLTFRQKMEMGCTYELIKSGMKPRYCIFCGVIITDNNISTVMARSRDGSWASDACQKCVNE